MLKLTRKGKKITVETATGKITWDADRGGDIVYFACKNEMETHSLVNEKDTICGLKFIIGGRVYRSCETRAKLNVESVDEDRIIIKNETSIAGGIIKITRIYEIHPEGALFCEQIFDAEPRESFTLSEISMNTFLDVSTAKSARWGYFTREPWYKRDYSTTHVFYGMDLYKNLDDVSCHNELWPLASIDLGWESTKFFSNKIEFVLDEWVSFNYADRGYTMSFGGRQANKWTLQWYILHGIQMQVSQPVRYRNKWGMIFLTAKNQNEETTDVALRNNVLGCRVSHCMYPYAQIGKDWPWVVMPIKQVACQPPQLFKGNPDIKRVDEAADLGANVIIIHQFWMRNPGTNCEPPADYIVKDPEWFKAFVDRCHERGMRVLTYIRGCEQYQMYQTWFEDYLRKDWDGFYPDWNSPHAMGFTKTSLLHWSSYAYFMYMKAMRKRVGRYGAIIGHTGFPFALTQSCIDVALCGELSIRHDELLTVPESTSYFACLDCSGAHLIAGNLKDRAEFSGKKAAAICSAFGMTGHPVLEPGVPFEKAVAYIKPLWDAMLSLPGKIIKLHNPAYTPSQAINCNEFWLFPSLWQSDQGKCLLLITNLSDNERKSGKLEVDTKKLDLPKNSKMRVLKITGSFPEHVEFKGKMLKIKNLPPLSFSAVMLE